MNRPAESSCALGICTGTGLCGVCVPGRGLCTETGRRLCGDDGQWLDQPQCETYSTCDSGRCLQPALDWTWKTEGTGFLSADDLAFAGEGKLLVSGSAVGSAAIGSLYAKTVDQQAVFVARLDRANGGAEAVFDVDPTNSGFAVGGRLSVAPNGMVVLGTKISGDYGGYTLGSEYAGMVASRSGTFVSRFERLFSIGSTDPLSAEVRRVDDVVATNLYDYVAVSFDQYIQWGTDSPPYSSSASGTGCRMLLARLDAGTGNVGWTANYAWCSGDNGKIMKLGPNGELYVGGPGRSNNEVVPPVLGVTTLTSAESAVLARFDAATGNVTRVRELPCSSFGAVRDLAFFANGDTLAAVTCSGTFSPGGVTLPDAAGYLVRLSADLQVIGAAPLGQKLGDYTDFYELSAAIGAGDVVYVAGTVAGDYDFGAGRHTSLGTCFRCGGGDAFVASYTGALVSRWSLPIASTGEEHGVAIERDADRVYVAATLGGPTTVLGHDLVPTGSRGVLVLALTE